MTNLLLSTMGLSEVLELSGFGFGIVLAVLAFLSIFVIGLSSFFKKKKNGRGSSSTWLMGTFTFSKP